MKKKYNKFVFLLLFIPFIYIAIAFFTISEEDTLLYLYAKEEYKNGNVKKAINMFNDVCKINPFFFQAQFGLAKSYFFDCQYKKAENKINYILFFKPNYYDANIFKIRLDIQNNKITKAENRLNKLMIYNSSDITLFSLKAKISEINDDYKNAIDYYKKALLQKENIARINIDYAKLYWKLGLDFKAKEEIDNTLQILSKDSVLSNSIIALKQHLNSKE